MNLRAFVLVFGYVSAQEYFEQLHSAKYGRHVEEIPKIFELRGGNAVSEFGKQFNHIQEIAKRDNLTVIYKVKLELVKPFAKRLYKKLVSKKGKSKKYNVPLKKNSMKLSNFEVFLRKMAESTGRKSQYNVFEVTGTTERQNMISTKQTLLKYKPIISKVRTKYTKIIRPVKNRVITLTV